MQVEVWVSSPEPAVGGHSHSENGVLEQASQGPSLLRICPVEPFIDIGPEVNEMHGGL